MITMFYQTPFGEIKLTYRGIVFLPVNPEYGNYMWEYLPSGVKDWIFLKLQQSLKVEAYKGEC